MIFYNDPTYYYEGEFKNGKFHGNGRFVNRSGAISSGSWFENYQYGLGSYYADGLIILSNFKNSMQTEDRGLLFDVLKKHQDIAFSRFNKVNLLTPSTIILPWPELATKRTEKRDEYGDVVSEDSELTSVFVDKEFPCLENKTNRNIYIRCYRKKFYDDSKQYEYIDDSFVLRPGGKVMTNYRLPPDNPIGYHVYYRENDNSFVFLGQYGLADGKQPITVFEWEKAMGYGAMPAATSTDSPQRAAETNQGQPVKATVAPQQTRTAVSSEQLKQIAESEKRLDEEDELKKYPIILFFDPSGDTTFPSDQFQNNFRVMKNIAKTLQEHPTLKITIDGYSSHSKPKKREKLGYARAYKVWDYLVTVCKVDSRQILPGKGSWATHPRGDVVQISYQ